MGDWKSNLTFKQCESFVTKLNECKFDENRIDLVVAPIPLHLAMVKACVNSNINVAA